MATAIWANGGLRIDLNRTALAVGDLVIDWGVPTGDPIFVVTEMVPGQMESRSVDVDNVGAVTRPVGVRGVETSETGGLASVIDFKISQGATDLYGGTSSTGPRTLEQFFTDSAGMNGLFLSNLASGASTTYTFKATFDIEAGNEFQNAEVIFDLIIGITMEIPAECTGLEFSGSPIFGTSGSDSLNGTSGNDLIFGLEGTDSINGRGGDDCLVGGLGTDSLKGNQGNDVLLGNEDTDSLKGDLGNDKLYGGEGTDSLKGENGEDQLFGGGGIDSLEGGNGSDILKGEVGDDSLKGGNGDDNLDGGPGVDSLKGNNGTDTCTNGEAVSTCEL
jgi:Ca2+-binding RTX toxin-like protein